MADSRTRWLQALWLLLAAGLLTAAGLLQPRLDTLSREAGLSADNAVQQQNPNASVLAFLPGAIRAPILNYLWIEAEELKVKGKFYDSLQKAQFITDLQPHFAGAIVFQAWNMAYNISVETRTLEHRWHWVYRGISLLRDRGIPQNPWSLALYKELAWIFYHKIGGYMDDFHEGYKSRWAFLMQRLLAPPPWGTTREAMDAFRPIAEAPLDHDPVRQGAKGERIQADQLVIVLKDSPCAEYASMLKARGVAIDDSLLDAYNRFSRDEAIQATWVIPPPAPDPNSPESALAALINDSNFAAPRARLLAFVRAQLLWNDYRMDPQWMLGLMERYGPLDWRLPWPHAMYWATYGFHAAEGTPVESLGESDALNNSRIILFSLQDLTRQGRATVEENPGQGDLVGLRLFADPRFIEFAHREYLRLIQIGREQRQESDEMTIFRVGHINYLIGAIQMLFVHYRNDEARKYLQYVRDAYHMNDEMWSMDLDDFVVAQLNTDSEPGRFTAQSLIPVAIQTSYMLALANDTRGARAMIGRARFMYDKYQANVPERNRLAPLVELQAQAVAWLLARPQAVGYNLTLQARASLWRVADNRVQSMIYARLAPLLKELCQAEGVDFNAAFPAPR
jgi:hypothetical protein